MSTDTPDSTDGPNGPVPPSAPNRPELKRTLKDLLVQDDVSDSDVEMLEKHSLDGEKLDQNDENIDPDMCVECGDQVSPTEVMDNSREQHYTAINVKSNSARYVSTTSSIERDNAKHIRSLFSIQMSPCINRPHKSISPNLPPHKQMDILMMMKILP